MTLTAPQHPADDRPPVPSARPSAAAPVPSAAVPAVAVVAVVVLVLGLVAAVAVVTFRMPDRREPQLTARILVPADAPAQQAAVAAPAVPAAPAAGTQWRIGNWTPERGRLIAERALRWLGTPYSFAGGNASGPTYGVPVDHASRNDGSVRGFDCSGLVLYALAPWLRVDHLASAQYRQTGSVHPSIRSLLPGDLVFWSSDGTIGKVHHVAIYIGGGNVVQAPASGQLITVTPLGRVSNDTIGTVRPLT